MTTNKRKKPSLATLVLIGFGLGIATGIFFGEIVEPLNALGMAFIRLLQMSVLPYITVSLIRGLGRMSYAKAGKLARKAGLIMVMLWSLALIAVALFPIAFPNWQTSAFFSTSTLQLAPPPDFVALYIPSNPFHSLANSVIPAVVVFSIALGIALIGVKNKEGLLDTLDAIGEALGRITAFVVRLAPVGVFAIAASAAGTMGIDQLIRLQVYLITYVLVWAVMAFWVIPALVTSFTPLRYGEVIGMTRDALVTAFATGSLMVVIPILAEKSRQILGRHDIAGEETESAIGVIVPTSFSFPSSGALLSLAFVLFGGWLASAPLSVAQYPVLASVGLVSFFGSPTLAMPFLLDLFRLPADLFQVFIVADVLIARFGTLLAAVHVLVLGLLSACALAGRVRVRGRAVVRYAAVTVALLVVAVGGSRLFFTYVMKEEYRNYQLFIEMELAGPTVPTVHHETPPPPDADPSMPALQRIRERGSIRVGYFKDALPSVFRNANANLVGLDAELAHRLARDMQVNLEFVLIDYFEIAENLDAGHCDVVMSGVPITTDRSLKVDFSSPYMSETVAFVVEDHRRDEFNSRDVVRAHEDLRVGLLDRHYFKRWLEEYLPDATIVPLDNLRDFFRAPPGKMDAMVYSAEAGSAWSLIYPDFTVSIPRPDIIEVPMAFPVRRGDPEWVGFLNNWIELRKRDGTVRAAYDHWILGKATQEDNPRWSVVRDVLHWVD